MNEKHDTADLVSKALRKAWQLGQDYWQHANSEYRSDWRKVDATRYAFDQLVEDTKAILTSNSCAQTAPIVPDGWVRAVDEALVTAHIGVANERDTYEQAREKLNNLIGWYTDVATDPAVNGGYKLMPAEPTKEIYECFAAYDGSSYSNPFDFDDFREDYLAAINSTGLPVEAKLYALPGAQGEEK